MGAAGPFDGWLVWCSGPPEMVENAFDVRESVRLEVDGFNGTITVNSGSEGRVLVTTIQQPDRVEYTAKQDGERIVIEARRLGGPDPVVRASAKIEVTVPGSTYVDLENSHGSIEISNIAGGGILHTSDAAITATNVEGDYKLETNNGRVRLENVRGTFDVRTSNDIIDFDGELVPGGKSQIQNSNGSVRVSLRGIPSVRLDASVSNGTIVSSLPITTTSSDKDHLKGTIGGADAELSVQTSNGSIKFRQVSCGSSRKKSSI